MTQDPDELIEAAQLDPAQRADPGAVIGGLDHPRCRYADVNTGLRGPDLRPPAVPEDNSMVDLFRRWMIYTSGEKHRQLRSRFSSYFGPRQAERFRETITSRVGARLDLLAGEGRMEVLGDVVHPTTFPLICDTLGVPDATRPELRDCAELFEDALPRQSDPEWAARGAEATTRMMDVLEELLAERRREPREDFLGVLAARELGDHEEWRDVAANCAFLLSNAFGSTPTLTAGCVHLALENPAAVAGLQAGDFTTEAYVEECARLLTPITYALRVDGADGMEPYYLAAANRDPSVFPDPDRLDPTRSPNRHLSFLVGPHACLGASVARLIAVITLEAMLTRLPGLRRDGPAEWASAYPLHRLARLPVAWDAVV